MMETSKPGEDCSRAAYGPMTWSDWGSCGFPNRVNHATTAFTDGKGRRRVYAMGGFAGRGRAAEGAEHWNDLGEVDLDVFELDADAKTWTKVYPSATTQDALPGRYAHSCVTYKGKIYMYGGRNDEMFIYDVQCFDPETREWETLKTTAENCPLPEGRYAHACTTNGPIMYIQGGTVFRGLYLTYTAELLSFNMETHRWRQEQFSQPLDLQKMPLARDFHSGVFVNQSIFVFGGKSPYPDEDDDRFYKYSLTSCDWTEINIEGYHPPGRRSLSAVAFGPDGILYFGGFSTRAKVFHSDLFILNTATNQVVKLEPCGPRPCPRRRSGMCLAGSELIICGGVGLKQEQDEHDESAVLVTFGDMYVLNFVLSLQELSMLAISEEKLPVSHLPLRLQQSLSMMIKPPFTADRQQLP